MYRDETTSAIFSEIRNEIREETGEDFSLEEIYSICNSQFVAGGLAAQKRISVFYSYIGTFKIKNKKAYIQSVKDVESIKDKVSEEEYKEIVKQKQISNKKQFDASKLKLITDLKDLPENLSEVTVMKKYNKIYKELIDNEPINSNE